MIYDPQFKGILEVGHTVILKGSNFPAAGKNFRCIAIDALPQYIKDFGALSATTWDNDNEDTNLELGINELGQLRMMVIDDIRVKIKNPAPVAKWRTAKTSFYLPQLPITASEDWMKEYIFRLSEFFYWENTTPRFDIYSVPARDEARVLFTGWRFKLAEISEKGQFVLNVNGWPTVT